MSDKLPNFFENRNEPWRFEDVLDFIRTHFDVKDNVSYRVGEKQNSADENQRALIVLAYAQLMNYTFNQVKALFAEHDHFAIAMPETRQGRNILEVNNIYSKLLKEGLDYNVKINDVPEYFEIPNTVLTKKSARLA